MSWNEPTGPQSYRVIQNGWDVFASDGEKIGSVADVAGSYFTIEKGFLFKTELYVPFGAISSVEDDRVYLSVTKDEVESQNWDLVPDTESYEQTGMTTTSGMTGDYDRTDQYAATGRTTDFDEEEIHVPVTEEELQVRKHETERGRVRVHKDVIEDEQTINVPVREEQVHVERHPVDATTADSMDAFREQDIEIPVYGEEVDVTKEAVVREEVDISKDVHERDETVSDTVRREEVYVEGDDVDDSMRRPGSRRARRDTDLPDDFTEEGDRETPRL